MLAPQGQEHRHGMGAAVLAVGSHFVLQVGCWLPRLSLVFILPPPPRLALVVMDFFFSDGAECSSAGRDARAMRYFCLLQPLRMGLGFLPLKEFVLWQCWFICGVSI